MNLEEEIDFNSTQERDISKEFSDVLQESVKKKKKKEADKKSKSKSDDTEVTVKTVNTINKDQLIKLSKEDLAYIARQLKQLENEGLRQKDIDEEYESLLTDFKLNDFVSEYSLDATDEELSKSNTVKFIHKFYPELIPEYTELINTYRRHVKDTKARIKSLNEKLESRLISKEQFANEWYDKLKEIKKTELRLNFNLR